MLYLWQPSCDQVCSGSTQYGPPRVCQRILGGHHVRLNLTNSYHYLDRECAWCIDECGLRLEESVDGEIVKAIQYDIVFLLSIAADCSQISSHKSNYNIDCYAQNEPFRHLLASSCPPEDDTSSKTLIIFFCSNRSTVILAVALRGFGTRFWTEMISQNS